MLLYNNLFKNDLTYGIEFWGWTEFEEVRTIQERYLKWILDLNLVREETKREKLRVEARRRAVNTKITLAVIQRREERVNSQEKQMWQELCRRDFETQKQEGRGDKKF